MLAIAGERHDDQRRLIAEVLEMDVPSPPFDKWPKDSPTCT